ncbi:phosphopantothenoylcysteine synthetase/decarboxylase [Actinoplanes tereljensis]|uniref:Flavoprotein n=1 Tax=Paractinoplanes tereljensis TaxID=571912 RepID=A0A919NZ14_9ACTN|nr:flavoprotein [Actinoplanes tereljensis]GIF26267.1 flavoprotein [Actinoplanes tereljensis]
MGDLRIVVCGGGAANGVVGLIQEATRRGWSVDVTATQSGLDFFEKSEVARASGKPVRTTYKFAPDGRRISPPADGLIVAPATFNTINKLAAGIADTYPLSSVAEVIGRGVPTVVVPAVNSALAARLPFRRAIDDLRSEGVRVLFGPEDGWEPLPPGQNDPRKFPWLRALDLVEEAFGLTTVDQVGVPLRA